MDLTSPRLKRIAAAREKTKNDDMSHVLAKNFGKQEAPKVKMADRRSSVGYPNNFSMTARDNGLFHAVN